MMPGLIAAWALLFVRMVGDINASAILASSANIVVGFRVLEIYTYGSMADMAALATALTVISSSVLVTSLLLSRRWSRWSHPYEQRNIGAAALTRTT
jgi:iron(III) transport system permease protein